MPTKRPSSPPAARSPKPSRTRRPDRQRRRRRFTGRAGWWIVLGVVGIAVLAGIGIQASRSGSSSSGAPPRHALGPGNSEIEGRPSAPVLVEEYADYQCPSCARLHQEIGPTINQLVNAGTIRFAYHPMAFIGPESVAAASAAECAGDEGKYFAMSDQLYTHQFPENSGALTTEALVRLAEQAGVTKPATTQCIRSATYQGWVRKVTDENSQRGITSTPTVFVNGREFTGRTAQSLIAAVQAAEES